VGDQARGVKGAEDRVAEGLRLMSRGDFVQGGFMSVLQMQNGAMALRGRPARPINNSETLVVT